MPIPIPEECNIRLMNSELVKENKREYQKIIDLYVVLDGKIYIDIEINRSLFESVKLRNNLYKNKLSSLLLESGEDIKLLNEKNYIRLI